MVGIKFTITARSYWFYTTGWPTVFGTVDRIRIKIIGILIKKKFLSSFGKISEPELLPPAKRSVVKNIRPINRE